MEANFSAGRAFSEKPVNGAKRLREACARRGIEGVPPELPLVSVVTPVFNGERYLEETILSVLNQDYDNIEYIIIDGGSTDGTQAILKKYDDRIDYWISEPDNGIYDAMNKGIRLAKGELVGIINSDDYYTAGAVKSVADEASRHPKAHVFHGNMEFQQTHGAKELWRPRRTFTKYGLYRMPVNHPTVFVRSACYRECGVFDTRYRVAADYGLMLKFLLECASNFTI